VLEGDKDGCGETLGDAALADGLLEGPVDSSDEGLKEESRRLTFSQNRQGSFSRISSFVSTLAILINSF
jgi:hypothetical protein